MKTRFIFILFIPIYLLLFSSCVKEEATVAVITVRDTNNAVVENARVVLYGNPQPVLGTIVRFDTVYTDYNGQALFDYTDLFKKGQSGFAILDVRAQKGNLEGYGTIHIIEEETSQETVIIEL